jgi:hypothetical protein
VASSEVAKVGTRSECLFCTGVSAVLEIVAVRFRLPWPYLVIVIEGTLIPEDTKADSFTEFVTLMASPGPESRTTRRSSGERTARR